MPTAGNLDLAAYKAAVTEDIETCVSEMGCQPILFVGSGLSMRYFSGPSWDGLLAILAKRCPLIDKDYAYYKQTLKDLALIGSEFARLYQRWAWEDGRDQFPAGLFAPDVPANAYIKFIIADLLRSMTPETIGAIAADDKRAEAAALQEIHPHALITTNYDQFLEVLFPEYQPIIGQSIIRGRQLLTGEIFKIHGCVSDYTSLVFTQEDYEEFTKKKKYLSAKLLTYFSEHPLLFIGYSATDANIRAILADIDECLPYGDGSGGVIPNIYLLEWRDSIATNYTPAREKVISIGDGRSIRIKSIEATDFSWVFKAFAANQPLNAISPKVLRALINRSYDLVREDIPRKTISVDFKILEGAVASDETFAKLFGITTIGNGSAANAGHPYLLSDVAARVIGVEGARWQQIHPLVERLSNELGKNLKLSDNRYHIKVKSGRSTFIHKYSNEFLEILLHMSKGTSYEVLPID